MENLVTSLKQLWTNIKEFWSKLTLNQKVIGSGVVLLVTIMIRDFCIIQKNAFKKGS
jgi:flagellar biosynthesis/type III secretory pathway M-ring protein FliF/YscJ